MQHPVHNTHCVNVVHANCNTHILRSIFRLKSGIIKTDFQCLVQLDKTAKYKDALSQKIRGWHCTCSSCSEILITTL